ncbi:PPK2 family polyphosphate kinase [Flavobacterium psychraquaticum]|uniref:PPK2 family polyphosphate kinase n=1 Tax=Flavobacterium psychraquaticum TaxID=3103958 RepID=UPI002ACD4086|nr:PPK2 family polyphosphate kinase [Flavobacterium sp. LB-N7T]
MENINIEDFRVKGAIKLADFATELYLDTDKKDEVEALDKIQKKLSEKQDAMYAHNRHAFLICLQGMDTSGKDSLIREVFKEFNPRGVVVHSFKTPNSTELEHDYLWRHYLALPEKGKFAVFNRTHYENVLVTRVHPEYILFENLPGIENVEDITPQFWENRMEQIVNFEKHIAQNGTTILKFYFHMSKEEQGKRLMKRLNNAEDNWKFSVGDIKERERWDDYMRYYEEAINKTATPFAPWYIIPSDDKGVARYIVAKIIWEALKALTDITEPELDPKVKANIDFYRDQLKE